MTAWLSWALPLAVTLWRLTPSTQWRDDLAVVRGLGLVPVGGEGVVSSTLVQLAALLPVGGRVMRAALVSAVGLALASWLVHRLVVRLLDENATAPRLTPALALCAALISGLSPVWQTEGTIAGGGTLAAALGLSCLLLRPGVDERDARTWFGFGALLVATALESRISGVCVALALVVQTIVSRDLPPRRTLWISALGAAAMAAIGLVPAVARPLAKAAWVDATYQLPGAALAASSSDVVGMGTLLSWLGEMGVVSVALASAGALWGAAISRTRWLVLPLVAWTIVDLLLPPGDSVLTPDAMIGARLLAVAALAVLAMLAVQTVAVGAERAKIFMARPAAVLLVVFSFTLVIVTAEDAGHLADRPAQYGAEVWTDEAIGSLPPESVLLVRSEPVAWRLWAAAIARGERPDVVVVPLSLLDRGSIAAHLLEAEPALAPLIREVAITGTPSEFALSTLADARPLYVEFNPAWDDRLMDHLLPHPFWMRFEPHAVGRSDREARLHTARDAFRRVLAVADSPDGRDRGTLAMLSARAREQAALLAALGDRDAVVNISDDLRSAQLAKPFLAELDRRLAESRRGRIDITGLLP